MEEENFGKCCQSTGSYCRVTAAPRLPCATHRQCVRPGIVFELDNKDPKTAALIAGKPALEPSPGQHVVWSATVPGGHSPGSTGLHSFRMDLEHFTPFIFLVYFSYSCFKRISSLLSSRPSYPMAFGLDGALQI